MENEVKERKFSVGYFFLALLPCIVCIVLQIVMAMVVMMGYIFIGIASKMDALTDQEAYMDMVMEVAEKASSPSVLAYHVVGTLVFGLWYYFSFKKPRPTVVDSAKRLNLLIVISSIIAGIGLCFFANASIVVDNYLIPKSLENYIKLAEQAGFGVNALAIVASVCLAPIGEEFLCRGITLYYGKKAFGNFWAANVLQAFLFALIHMNLIQGIYAFFIGLAAGWLAERTKSLIPAIILHFVVNFSSSTWIGYVVNALWGEDMPSLFVGIIFTLASAGIVVLFLYLVNKQLVKNEGENNTVAM